MGKLLEKVKRKFNRLIYALPFALKAGDEMLTTSNPNLDGGITSQQKQTSQSVWKDLLEGNITQEVEELRYSTHKVTEESLNYEYLGNGVAIKKNNVSVGEEARDIKHFFQPNLSLEYSVLEAQQLAETNNIDLPDKKVVQINYGNNTPRFRLESLAEKIDINLLDGIVTQLYIPIIKNDRKRVPFINYVKNFLSGLDKAPNKENFMSHSELCDNLKALSFTTCKASNNLPDGMEWSFSEGSFQTVKVENDYVIITYKWWEVNKGKLLSEKYYSKTQDQKYQEKAKKEGYVPTVNF